MTTKHTHTPGPWFSNRDGFSTVYVEARIRPGILQEVAACGPTEAGQDQQEANACLIAAALELLEALQAEEEWRAREADGALDPEWDYDTMVASKRRAAILKATGEQA